jgi:cell division topological specificity factor MinE
MAGYDDAGNPIGRDTTFGRLAGSSSLQTAPASAASFWGKVKAAFAIFFPPSEEETARLEAKKRLRMILVADRCAMSGRAMAEMKRQIVDVVQTFVDVDEEAGVEMSTTQDPGSSGTLYSVSIPVRGVKPQFDVENETYGWEEEPIYESDAWGEEEDETAKSSAANRVEPPTNERRPASDGANEAAPPKTSAPKSTSPRNAKGRKKKGSSSPSAAGER